jgi:hypothetical protein
MLELLGEGASPGRARQQKQCITALISHATRLALHFVGIQTDFIFVGLQILAAQCARLWANWLGRN